MPDNTGDKLIKKGFGNLLDLVASTNTEGKQTFVAVDISKKEKKDDDGLIVPKINYVEDEACDGKAR